MNAEQIARALGNGRRVGNGWMARCPLACEHQHGDANPSLSISERAGKILVHCQSQHANEQDQVIAALRELGLWRDANASETLNGKRTVATYDYCDESGAPLFQVVRYEPKDFLQRQPDGKGGWIWNLKGVRRVLYRLPELLANNRNETVWIVEGEKDADALAALGLVATTNPGGAGKWCGEYNEPLRGRRVAILPDNDQPGENHARVIAASLTGVAASVRIVRLSGLPEKGDLSDWLAAGGTRDALLELVEQTPALTAADVADPANSRPALRVYNVADLLALKLPPREFILEPILRERDLMMIYSWRGVGKTMLALAIAYAIASGAKLFNWKSPRPRRVLYVDGELPLQTLQERLAWLIDSQDAQPPEPGYLQFLTHDAQESGLPDLASREGQESMEPHISGIDVLTLDSFSTLVRSGKENPAEDWQPVQDWILRLRRMGKTISMLHHEGKGGAQRGTSKREDVLDTVLRLRHPADYSPDEGARFEVHFEKCRALLGQSAKPFEARLETIDGRADWQTRDLTDANFERAKEMFGMGMSVRDVAEELKITKSVAGRLRLKWKASQGTNGTWNSKTA
jgi:hypothetical protein